VAEISISKVALLLNIRYSKYYNKICSRTGSIEGNVFKTIIPSTFEPSGQIGGQAGEHEDKTVESLDFCKRCVSDRA